MVTTGRLLARGVAAVALMLMLAGWQPAVAGERNWMLLDSIPDHSEFFYDQAGVARSGEGILTVWAKVRYGEKGREETLELLHHPPAYAGLSFTEYRYELDCRKHLSRLQQVIHFDDRGERITAFDLAGKTEWEEVPPASRVELVLDAECQEPQAPAGSGLPAR